MLRVPRLAMLALVGALALPVAVIAAEPIPAGVYECDAPINVGGMMMGSPQTGLMFGVTGPAAYRDFNGGKGGFALSGDLLTMTSGPLKGTRYRRQGPTLFRPLNAAGAIGPTRCLLNKSKTLTGRW